MGLSTMLLKLVTGTPLGSRRSPTLLRHLPLTYLTTARHLRLLNTQLASHCQLETNLERVPVFKPDAKQGAYRSQKYYDSSMGWVHGLNERVADSKVGRYFELKARKSTFSTEIRAGVVCFLTTCYILAVNSSILADTGGTCSDADCTGPKAGQPGCRFTDDPGFIACQQEVRRSIISATAATSLMACFLMGAVANLPLAVAPGMGINAYFAYTVVGYLGTGKITYQEALAAVFIEGWIFILISLTGVRGRLVSLVPKSIMLATAGGIGLFLAFIGLQSSEGIGLIGYNSATLVTLGGCPLENRVYQYTIANTSAAAVCVNNADTGLLEAKLGPPSSSYMCASKRMHSACLWLGIVGLCIMVLLMGRRVKGSIMIGILFVTFVSWIPYHKATYFGEASQIKGGVERFNYFRNVVAVPDASKTTLAWSFAAFGRSELWVALITFLYLDFLDATGTLFSMATMLSQRIPGFVNDKDKTFPRQLFAFCVDGVAIVIGSLLGCAPLTVYIESASGIREGGRTGITAIVVAIGFFISLFLTPLIASIPPFATGPALILVGAMMMENLVDIDWANVRQAVPAFITIVTMPLTYSIAYGVIAGVCSYLVLYMFNFGLDLVEVAFKRKSLDAVMYDNCPDVFQDLMKKPRADKHGVPFKSVSAVLQEHVNPEHAAHFAAVKAGKDAEAFAGDAPGALPTSKPDAAAAEK